MDVPCGTEGDPTPDGLNHSDQGTNRSGRPGSNRHGQLGRSSSRLLVTRCYVAKSGLSCTFEQPFVTVGYPSFPCLRARSRTTSGRNTAYHCQYDCLPRAACRMIGTREGTSQVRSRSSMSPTTATDTWRGRRSVGREACSPDL